MMSKMTTFFSYQIFFQITITKRQNYVKVKQVIKIISKRHRVVHTAPWVAALSKEKSLATARIDCMMEDCSVVQVPLL